MDARWVGVRAGLPSGYEVVTHGGRHPTGLDAVEWARRAEAMGAGEICLNSIDADGTLEGYEIRLTRLISTSVGIPVIASGGAGRPEHLVSVLREGCADAALIASMVHLGGYRMADLKRHLSGAGIPVRMTW
jgi:cyclase